MVEAVLAAVPVVVKRYGAASITTNRIAEVAGVSIGSLYQYFPDKRSVFGALHERHVGDVRRILERNVASKSYRLSAELWSISLRSLSMCIPSTRNCTS